MPSTPEYQRSSSVPATPICDSHLDSPGANDSHGRRSIDIADVVIVIGPVGVKQDAGDMVKDDTALQVLLFSILNSPSILGNPRIPSTVPDLPVLVPPPDMAGDHMTIVAPEKVSGKEGKDKDESWARPSRQITTLVGLARQPESERKDKNCGTPSLIPTPLMSKNLSRY